MLWRHRYEMAIFIIYVAPLSNYLHLSWTSIQKIFKKAATLHIVKRPRVQTHCPWMFVVWPWTAHSANSRQPHKRGIYSTLFSNLLSTCNIPILNFGRLSRFVCYNMMFCTSEMMKSLHTTPWVYDSFLSYGEFRAPPIKLNLTEIWKSLNMV